MPASKIVRKTQLQFAGTITPTSNIAQFGSLQAASPAYSGDPATIQSLPAWGLGWSGAVINNAAPCIQDMTAVQYVFSYQLGYMLQQGIAEYDASTNYFVGSLVSDGVGRIYMSVTNVNIGNPLSSTANWILYFSNNVTTASTTYAVIYSDSYIRCTGTTGYTVTLPVPFSLNTGRQLTIKSVLSYSALLTVSGAIDTASSITLTPYQTITLVSNSTTWDII